MNDVAQSDLLEQLNQHRGGLNALIGLTFTRAEPDALEAEVPVTPALHQPHGLVHGGVYAAIVETLASTAALVHARSESPGIVGLENSTSFLRAVREGTLRARARPLTRGRRTQVWEVEIRGDDGKLAATGRVRLLAVESDAPVAGAELRVASPPE